jgi:hypothetical protein
MHLLYELLAETKQRELALAREHGAPGRRGRERAGVRARIGGWLVHAGLWVDPRVLDERLEQLFASDGVAGAESPLNVNKAFN